MKESHILVVIAGVIFLLLASCMAYNVFVDRHYGYSNSHYDGGTSIRVFPLFDLRIGQTPEWREMYRRGYRHGYDGSWRWRNNEPYNLGYDRGARDRCRHYRYHCPY